MTPTPSSPVEAVASLVERLRKRAANPLISDTHELLTEAADEIERLRAALNASTVALNDWVVSYAPDMCSAEDVAAMQQRVGKIGTLAYIADAMEVVHAALNPSPSINAFAPVGERE